MRTKHTFLFTMLLGLAWAGYLFAYATGPDPGVNGVFGASNTCNQAGCHVGNPLNASGGTISVTGLPTAWTPGQLYPLTITAQKTGVTLFGFQFSAVFDSTSTQAGTLTKGKTSGTDATRIDIVSGLGIQFAQHNTSNSALAPTSTFFVNWTAPATTSGGTVRFNLAVNAANRDGNNTGDFIYTSTTKVAPGTVTNPPDFSLSASAGTASVTAGGSTTLKFSAAGANGFTGNVDLSLSGLPSGATGTFSPSSIASGAESTLTINTTNATAAGAYQLTITGTSGSLTHTANASLTIAAAQTGSTTKDFNVVNFGGNSSSTDGSGNTVAGYVRIQPNGGNTTPSGVEIFGYRPGGVLVTETGVPASPLITSGRIYAEVNQQVNTGIAIANPNATAATINFFFTKEDGTDFGAGTTLIPANFQIANFIDQAPYNGGSTVQGTFSFTSSVPVSVVALRGFTNEIRHDFLLSTLPVIDTAAAAPTGTQVLPHFVNASGGWTTQVILVNSGATALTGSLQFLSTAGAALTVTSSSTYSVPPRSAQKFVTSGGDASGSVRVVPTGGGTAPVPLVVFSQKLGGNTLTEASALANSGTAYRMYVESSGTPSQPGNISSGFAVASATSAGPTVTFEVFDLNGNGIASKTQPLSASGQTAGFVDTLFPTLPRPFKGVLRITAPSAISVVGLRGRYNERSEFLITTTPPTLESAPASAAELFFPHFVNGGGYTTQFILFSGTAGQTSVGTMRFFGQAGTALSLSLNN